MSKSKRMWLIASMVLIAIVITVLVSFDKFDDTLYKTQLIESIERGKNLTPEQEYKNKEIYLKISKIEATNESTNLLVVINHIIIVVLLAMFLTAFAYYVQSNWDMDESDNRDYVLSNFFKAILLACAIIYFGASTAKAETSPIGVNLIKHYEGFRNTAYQDVVGVWTIGYGTTKNVKKGDFISTAQAEYLLKKDLYRFENYVKNRIPRAMSTFQFDALVSFTYNIGSIYGNFYNAVMADRIEQVTYWINKYVKAGGVVYKGLVNRRRDEGNLYAGDKATIRKYSPKARVCYAK